ncbi:MAG: hypothetical protein IJS08_14795 [Victivallales bacterium]|nr:hypothetical protein [Victivallales bacterium]
MKTVVLQRENTHFEFYTGLRKGLSGFLIGRFGNQHDRDIQGIKILDVFLKYQLKENELWPTTQMS